MKKITVWKKIINDVVDFNHTEEGHAYYDKPLSTRYMLGKVDNKEDIKIWNKCS